MSLQLMEPRILGATATWTEIMKVRKTVLSKLTK